MQVFQKFVRSIFLTIIFSGMFFLSNIYSQTLGSAPYLQVTNIIADSDTLPVSSRLKLAWHYKKLRIEFDVLPEDSPDYQIEYKVSGRTPYSGKTKNRFFEFVSLAPEMNFRIMLSLSMYGKWMLGSSNLDLSIQVLPRPAPVIKLKDVIVDQKSLGASTMLELKHGKHDIQFLFAVEPADYPGSKLCYDFLGPDFEYSERRIENNRLAFELNTPGEYRLRLILFGVLGSSKLQVRFRIRESFLKKNPRAAALLGILGYFIINLIFAFLIVKDANKTNRESRYWVIFTLFTSIFGYLIYKIYTSASQVHCPECNELILPKYKYCPFCQTQLKESCPDCNTDMQTWMHYCSACGSDLRPKRQEAGKGK